MPVRVREIRYLSRTAVSAEREGYLAFRPSIEGKAAIKTTLEGDAALQETIAVHHTALESWWAVARDDFAGLRDGKKLPEVRHELITTLRSKLVPVGVLDEFKSAGVFVNWWQQIRYDLKTVVSTGWHHTLIPDSYLITAFFQRDAEAIEAIEATITEVQSELEEAVEAAQEVAAYEPEEDETITAAVIKKVLKELIDDLEDSTGKSAEKELQTLQERLDAILSVEKRVKEAKVKLKTLTDELEQKIQLKRLGADDFLAETKHLLAHVESQLKPLDESKKDEKKKSAALKKDKIALEARIAKTDALLSTIGGVLTDADAKTLILKKLYDLALADLDRYLNAEKRGLVRAVETLWEKYSVSARMLESHRADTMKALTECLTALGYTE